MTTHELQDIIERTLDLSRYGRHAPTSEQIGWNLRKEMSGLTPTEDLLFVTRHTAKHNKNKGDALRVMGFYLATAGNLYAGMSLLLSSSVGITEVALAGIASIGGWYVRGELSDMAHAFDVVADTYAQAHDVLQQRYKPDAGIF